MSLFYQQAFTYFLFLIKQFGTKQIYLNPESTSLRVSDASCDALCAPSLSWMTQDRMCLDLPGQSRSIVTPADHAPRTSRHVCHRAQRRADGTHNTSVSSRRAAHLVLSVVPASRCVQIAHCRPDWALLLTHCRRMFGAHIRTCECAQIIRDFVKND